MQSAKSIRFGGLLLDAEDCDYTDFINHGLVCPICTGTVFLVSSASRGKHSRTLKSGESVSVKESTIPAHFAHHHNADKSAIANCELRSAKMTNAQRQVFQAKARGQVARLFQQKFWRMLQTSIKLTAIDEAPVLLLDLWQQASLRQPIAAKAQLAVLIDMLARQFSKAGQVSHSKEGLEGAIEEWGIKISRNPKEIPQRYKSQFKAWLNVLDRQMQTLIVSQALDFICHKKQEKILFKLIELGVYNWILAESSCAILESQGAVSGSLRGQVYNRLMQEESVACVAHQLSQATDSMRPAMVRTTRMLIGLDREAFEALFMFVRDDVVQSLTFVDWATQFEEAQTKQEEFS